MLLADRRTRLTHLCLMGMEVAWFALLWALVYPPAAASPWAAYFGLVAALVAWVLVLEWLGHTAIKSLAYDLVALGLMALTSLLAVRLLLYGGVPALDFRWIGLLVRGLDDFSRGVPPALALIAANLFLWQRATVATSRDLGFFSVGLSFRLGLLLIIAGLGLWLLLRRPAPATFLWLYVFLGLLGVALARINDKAADAQSVGDPLKAGRALQLVLAIGLTLGAARLLVAVYTPDGVRGFLHLLDPLWRLLDPVLELVLWLIAQILNPILLWLEAVLQGLMHGKWLEQQPELPLFDLKRLTEGQQPVRFPQWVTDAMLGIIVVVVALALAALLLGLLLLYLEKARAAAERTEGEDEGREALTFGGGMLARGLRSLRDTARLVRRYGLSRRLLEAITVQNMYANLCRLAARRGFGRPPAQPPDAYLPALARAFPGRDEALARITAAYMRVHYGDRPMTGSELLRVREDYLATRRSSAAARPRS